MLQTEGVSRCSLLLSADWLGEDNRVEVEVNGKLIRLKLRASKKLLLEDFVERFDRTFLPVAEAKIKKF